MQNVFSLGGSVVDEIPTQTSYYEIMFIVLVQIIRQFANEQELEKKYMYTRTCNWSGVA